MKYLSTIPGVYAFPYVMSSKNSNNRIALPTLQASTKKPLHGVHHWSVLIFRTPAPEKCTSSWKVLYWLIRWKVDQTTHQTSGRSKQHGSPQGTLQWRMQYQPTHCRWGTKNVSAICSTTRMKRHFCSLSAWINSKPCSTYLSWKGSQCRR